MMTFDQCNIDIAQAEKKWVDEHPNQWMLSALIAAGAVFFLMRRQQHKKVTGDELGAAKRKFRV